MLVNGWLWLIMPIHVENLKLILFRQQYYQHYIHWCFKSIITFTKNIYILNIWPTVQYINVISRTHVPSNPLNIWPTVQYLNVISRTHAPSNLLNIWPTVQYLNVISRTHVPSNLLNIWPTVQYLNVISRTHAPSSLLILLCSSVLLD